MRITQKKNTKYIFCIFATKETTKEMNTYNWNCRTVDTYPTSRENTDVVYNVHYQVTAVSDTLDPQGVAYNATNIGTQTLSTDDITDFTAFADLTHEDIVSWTKSAMGTDRVDSIEESLDTQVESKITPVSVTKYIFDDVTAEEEVTEE